MTRRTDVEPSAGFVRRRHLINPAL